MTSLIEPIKIFKKIAQLIVSNIMYPKIIKLFNILVCIIIKHNERLFY